MWVEGMVGGIVIDLCGVVEVVVVGLEYCIVCFDFLCCF